MKIGSAVLLAITLTFASMPVNAEQLANPEDRELNGMPEPSNAPSEIAEVNRPTQTAQAVYLADAVARDRGNRSQLLVLGTAHLRLLPKDFDVARFQPLLDRLAEWAPDKIAIERIAGPQCDYLREYDAIYGGTAKRYCFDPGPARAALALNGPMAEQEVRKILSNSRPDRPPAERRRLAALFLATGDVTSALVQWFRLQEAERRAGDGLSADLIQTLSGQENAMSEHRIIAAKLAARLGHERVYPVDDHSYRSETDLDQTVYEKEIFQAWDNEWSRLRLPYIEAWDKRIIQNPNASVIDWYRSYNSPEAARLAVASDFGAALRADLPANSGRKYFAYWETRNLRMAANIREVIDDGARVLAIVGASHKPYYERYLGVTGDLEIVDVLHLLRP